VRNGDLGGTFPSAPADPIQRPSTPPPPPSDPIPPPPPADIAIPPPPSDVSVPPPPPADLEVKSSTEDPIDAPPAAKKKKTGWGFQPKATPLSVEELLRKKREADEAASKVWSTSHSL
jgi:ATP-dependent RNA helicase DDX23/PRP28